MPHQSSPTLAVGVAVSSGLRSNQPRLSPFWPPVVTTSHSRASTSGFKLRSPFFHLLRRLWLTPISLPMATPTPLEKNLASLETLVLQQNQRISDLEIELREDGRAKGWPSVEECTEESLAMFSAERLSPKDRWKLFQVSHVGMALPQEIGRACSDEVFTQQFSDRWQRILNRLTLGNKAGK